MYLFKFFLAIVSLLFWINYELITADVYDGGGGGGATYLLLVFLFPFMKTKWLRFSNDGFPVYLWYFWASIPQNGS